MTYASSPTETKKMNPGVINVPRLADTRLESRPNTRRVARLEPFQHRPHLIAVTSTLFNEAGAPRAVSRRQLAGT